MLTENEKEERIPGVHQGPGYVEAALDGAIHFLHSRPASSNLCCCLALARIADDLNYDKGRVEGYLRSYARSSKWLERLGVALSPAAVTQKEMLIALAEDGNRLVRAAARTRLRGEGVTLW